MQIPDIDSTELTELIRVRTTEGTKKAVGHIAVDERTSEQNTYNYLLMLGLEEYRRRAFGTDAAV